MSMRQRMGLATLILGGFLILWWGGPDSMTGFQVVRYSLYVLVGALAFVWPDKGGKGES